MSNGGERLTRRAVLQLAGGVAAGTTVASKVAGAVPERADADVVEGSTPSAAASFVVPETAVPDRFTPLEAPELSPLVEHLGTLNEQFYEADSAVRGYWAGNTPENPRWVLSSLALVCDNPLPSDHVEQGAAAFHADFIDQYDAETPPSVSVEGTTRPCRLGMDYCTTVRWGGGGEAPAQADRVYAIADGFRLKVVGEALLGTAVSKYGPKAPDIDPLLTRLSELQQQRFRQYWHRLGK